LLAQVGRDLADDQARRASVIRLAAIRGQRISPQVRGSGDVVCLLAA
jgi:hypothetical protein